MKKVKRLTAVILSALMMTSAFSALPVSAAEVESNTSAVSSDENFISGDYEYTLLDDGTIEISKYVGNDSDVTIPDEIDGKKVTSIGKGAFENNISIKNIEMSNNILSIYDGAYYNCQSLETIKLSNSLTEILVGAFGNCLSLKRIDLPDSLSYVDDFAFGNCESLETVNFPDKLSDNGFSKGLAKSVFENCINLTYVKLPDNLQYIGYGVFSGCNKLQKITIPQDVTSIGNKVFYNCTNLKSIIIPKDVSFIARDSFENCNILTINGYIGTYAETYAKENDFEFIAIDDKILTGDANQDGIINVNDVTYLQMHIAGNKNTDGSALIDETNKQLFDCVDMNKDGKLSVSDVTALQIYISNNNQKIN